MVDKPAAGPDTLKGDLLIRDTTTPPIIPEIIPADKGAPEANAIPRQSGSATKNTDKPAGKSCFSQFIRKYLILRFNFK